MPVTSPSINAFPPFSQILKCTWIPTPRFSFKHHFEEWGILFCSDIIGNMVLALMHINFVIVIPIKHFQLNFKSHFRGFPGSGRESICQFRGHGFHSWSGKNPHAAGQLTLWAATTEPPSHYYWSLGGSDGKESACNAGDLGSIPVLGRSPGEGNGNPLQCSCLKNPYRQRSLPGCRRWGRRVWHDWGANTFTEAQEP